MISLCLIAANCCFTAGVIAVREGRYDAAAVFLVLFVACLFSAFMKERAFINADKARHKFMINLGEMFKLIIKNKNVESGGESDEMQSCEQETDRGRD